MGFPESFAWGAAAASYQIEGAAFEDGKGLSIWDVFCRKEDAIWSGHTGDVACDHYHRYAEDVALMKEIGLRAYRLSVSWPRVLPAGTGEANPKGLDFYDRLIDALLEAGIVPYVTLFHWDYPYELYCRGGWLSPDSPDWFAEYVGLVVERLSDRVRHWMTFNEPQVFTHAGHNVGKHAPGDRLPLASLLRVAHNVLLAHGKAVQAMRAASKGECNAGYAPSCGPGIPASDSPEDIEAAKQAMFSVKAKTTGNVAWWMDPAIRGQYPQDGVELFGEDMPDIRDGDMETIRQPLDFLGVNIYQGRKFRAGEAGSPEQVPHALGDPMTAFRWWVTPEALRWGPKFLCERYGLPIYITENGMSNNDWISMDGKVHDPGRIDFLRRYLTQLGKAIDEGADVRGYFQWSIMDNFEWAHGYKERFGLIYVDYPTQKRVLKDSARWYKEVIASNGAALAEI